MHPTSAYNLNHYNNMSKKFTYENPSKYVPHKDGIVKSRISFLAEMLG